MRSVLNLVTVALAAGGVAAAISGPADVDGESPSIVVTTNILGDIVGEVVGDEGRVEVIMPVGSDPHEFAASARQAESMEEADLLVVNGAGFEQGMLDVIDSAIDAGAAAFTFSDHVDLLQLSDGQEPDDDHEEDHVDHDDGTDPHIWTDPQRMAMAVEALAAEVAALSGVDAATIARQADSYVAELGDLDLDIEQLLADVPPERRVLVTNHEVFGYFADRYDFEVIGAVIPSLTTNAGASAADLEELAAVIREQALPAIFGETTQPTELAEALADEVGSGVEVVELFTESLGDDGSGADSYVSMMRVNAERISAALG